MIHTQRVSYITTDDAVSAFCWKYITVWHRWQNMPDARPRFSRAMDRRKVLGIPAEYMGNLVHVTTWLTFQELIDPPLGEIARQHPFPSLLCFFPQNPQGD